MAPLGTPRLAIENISNRRRISVVTGLLAVIMGNFGFGDSKEYKAVCSRAHSSLPHSCTRQPLTP